jgi:hypothetical protein
MTNLIRAGAAAATLFVLAGCEEPVGPGQNYAQLQALPTSRACVSSLPPFGYWRYGWDSFDQYYVPPNGTILMGDDGGWCQIQFQHFFAGRPAQYPLAVKTPPAHGEVLVGSVGTSLRIAYRPAPGFAGTDDFTVHMTAPNPWDIPVHVIVVSR